MIDCGLPGRMARLQPMASLGASQLRELQVHCHQETWSLGTRRPLQWNESNLLYILEGELRLTYANGVSELLVGGCGQGRWPLGRVGQQPVAAQAITEVVLLHMDGPALDKLLTWDQSLSGCAGLPSGARKLSPALFTQGIFSSLPAAHVNTLLASFQPVPVQAGEVVINAGETGDAYYVIEKGRAEVFRRVGGAELPVAELGPGQSFGEEALVSGEERNACVRMRTAGRLLRLGKPEFLALLKAPLLHAIDLSEAQGLVQAGACWLDVRYPAEFAQDGCRGAMNVPLGELRNAFNILPRSRTYVAYCRTGRRSSAAAFLLAQQGFDARWLEGGMPPDYSVI